MLIKSVSFFPFSGEEGECITLVNFGNFNPQTNESMMITQRHMITFRPSRQLRDGLNV